MDFISDPAAMTPEERLTELAAILAQGYLRLRALPALAFLLTAPVAGSTLGVNRDLLVTPG